MSEAQSLEGQTAPCGAGVGGQQMHTSFMVGIRAVFQELEIKQGEAVRELIKVRHLAYGLVFPNETALFESEEFSRQTAAIAQFSTFNDFVARKSRLFLRQCFDNAHIILWLQWYNFFFI